MYRFKMLEHSDFWFRMQISERRCTQPPPPLFLGLPCSSSLTIVPLRSSHRHAYFDLLMVLHGKMNPHLKTKVFLDCPIWALSWSLRRGQVNHKLVFTVKWSDLGSSTPHLKTKVSMFSLSLLALLFRHITLVPWIVPFELFRGLITASKATTTFYSQPSGMFWGRFAICKFNLQTAEQIPCIRGAEEEEVDENLTITESKADKRRVQNKIFTSLQLLLQRFRSSLRVQWSNKTF